ncbi:putative PD-(D/E)XK family protein DUF4420 [Kribbella amoyensis]|uniref:Putative PD-(D/E)XK family protein DUF4420 n=1 Tax=Kribbella amoyensis TaxID=996641 RepID=A0A561B2R0_9ACTN|nr:PD-(D/E)XK motif protein [Kribbella amoyensis]TWD73153.1 putative PD-(D/E)XK family protein DUF4420 [Kribbella amoyensis]
MPGSEADRSDEGSSTIDGVGNGSSQRQEARHSPLELIEAYMRQGVKGTLPVDGAPAARFKVSPGHRRLSLLVQMSTDEPGPDLLTRANLTYSPFHESGSTWHCLDVVVDDNLSEVYPVLCTIVDKIQLGGDSFATAVHSVLSGLSDILAGRKGLSLEEQIGLFGELMVLLSLARYLSPVEAVTAWRGPRGEEHDFGLRHVDLEVKSTMAERRRHWITSMTQLAPTGDRQLQLVSLQITPSGLGPGMSLAGLVDTACSLPSVPAGEVARVLDQAGWRDWHRGAYRERWRLRSEVAFYVVDEQFPALTPPRVAAAMPGLERLTDIHYRIDVGGLETAPPLFPVELDPANATAREPEQ